VVELGKSPAVVFGRNPDMADIVLEHASISRRHAAVLHDGKGSLYMYDFGSTHGTYVDGQRLIAKDPTPLKEGSRVKFAESSRSYVFRLPSAAADNGTAESKGEERGAKSMLPPPPRAESGPPTSKGPGEKEEEDEAPLVLDKKALQQLPMSFGGSKKPGALSKDAMAAGIAEMMREIEESEKKREKQAAEGGGDEEGDDDDQDDSDDDMGPRPPRRGERGGQPVEDEEEEPPPPEDPVTKHQIPMSHEVALRGHHKSITCVAMDPAGSRVAVGGKDYKVLLYDFGGMDRTHKPFRELEPEDGNPVVAVSWR
jgi:pSer/pThr/pTyr-binding forkhead associated (FHA) protein